ncbi:MAG: VWA domain-containing protein [Planctomycetes bacterium]|nr:VWA domain-containing protein [Planctomycetota bacterium]
MTFTNPLGLLALLALPAVLVLHLFRRRLPERKVAALFLFADEVLVAAAGRTRTRLLRTPSLWLELAAALAFALWLAGLGFGGTAARHVVVVLDDSASMGATGTYQRARAAAAERLQQLAGGDLVSVLRSGPEATILVGPRARAATAAPALAEWRPVRARHDLGPTLALARELARDGEVVVVSDEARPAGAEDLTWIACGEALPNRAVLAAERRPNAGGGELVHARVAAFGRLPATPIELRLFDGDRELARQALTFQDGIAVAELPAPTAAPWLRLQLPADALAIDDAVWLAAHRPRPVRVANLLPAGLAAALAWPRVLAALPDCEVVADPRRAQLLLSTAPGALLPGQTEIVVAAAGETKLLASGPFVVDRAHDWWQGTSLDAVRWCFARRELPGRALVLAGNDVLASEELLAAGRRWWRALDPAAGNRVRAPDGPILCANVVEAGRLDAPGPAAPEVLLHHEARLRREPAAAATTLQLLAPHGQRRALAAGDVVAFVPDAPGLWRLVDDGGAEVATFAARFVDARESDLGALTTATFVAQQAAAATRGPTLARDESFERRLLALVVLVLLLLDWAWALRRSW